MSSRKRVSEEKAEETGEKKAKGIRAYFGKKEEFTPKLLRTPRQVLADMRTPSPKASSKASTASSDEEDSDKESSEEPQPMQRPSEPTASAASSAQESLPEESSEEPQPMQLPSEPTASAASSAQESLPGPSKIPEDRSPPASHQATTEKSDTSTDKVAHLDFKAWLGKRQPTRCLHPVCRGKYKFVQRMRRHYEENHAIRPNQRTRERDYNYARNQFNLYQGGKQVKIKMMIPLSTVKEAFKDYIL